MLSVIETSTPHPDSVRLSELLKEEFRDVFFESVLARDADPVLRGPWGTASIHLKEGAIPRKKRPFRQAEDREDALREML
jgi:hypothetical protein